MYLPYNITVYILWTILRQTYQLLQFIVWLCNRTHSRIIENKKDEIYMGSTQVLNILARHKFCVLNQPSGADNFLMTHKTFVDPEYVLKDHITLYYINKDEAVFVEVDEGVDITLSKYGAFVRFAQLNLAKKFIIMPMSSFHKLSERVGSTKAKIIFLCNTARCGSTLVNQVFEETGSSVAYSEPDAINALTQLKGVVSNEERNRIVKNCINLMCKPFYSKEVKSYIIKPTQPTMVEMSSIVKLFPNSSLMFIYRDGLKCSKSLAKICNEVPLLGVMLALGCRSAKLTKLCIEGMGLPADEYEVKLLSGIHFGALIWSVAVKQYLEFKEIGLEIAAIRYEDLVDDTTYAYQKVFEYCGLTYDAKAVEVAMGRDSQRGTPLSLKSLSKHKYDELTDEMKKQIDKLCDQCGLPHFPELYIAPGTISYRARDTSNTK